MESYSGFLNVVVTPGIKSSGELRGKILSVYTRSSDGILRSWLPQCSRAPTEARSI